MLLGAIPAGISRGRSCLPDRFFTATAARCNGPNHVFLRVDRAVRCSRLGAEKQQQHEHRVFLLHNLAPTFPASVLQQRSNFVC